MPSQPTNGDKESLSTEAPTRAKLRKGAFLGGGIFGVAFLVGVGFFCVGFIGPALSTLEARDWVATPCVIEKSSVQRRHRGGARRGISYSLDIQYHYEFEGQNYRSSRYWFIFGGTPGYDFRETVVKDHPEGKRTTCYVNPENPQEAVIHRGWHRGLLVWGLGSLAFVGIGAGGMAWVAGVYRRRTQSDLRRAWLPGHGSAEAEGGGSVTGAAGDDKPEAAEIAAEGGVVTLRPTMRRLGRFVYGVFGMIVWNGVAAFLTGRAVEGHREGDPNWVLTLVAVAFVLIGIAGIGRLIYIAMGLWNPVVVLTLNGRRLPLGETLELGWRIEGPKRRLRRLLVTLEGREEVMYDTGPKSKNSDQEVFAEIPVADVRDRAALKRGRGEVSLRLPERTMHSFEAKNNKIVWTLRVHGDVALWPDVREAYSMTLLPQSVGEPKGSPA